MILHHTYKHTTHTPFPMFSLLPQPCFGSHIIPIPPTHTHTHPVPTQFPPIYTSLLIQFTLPPFAFPCYYTFPLTSHYFTSKNHMIHTFYFPHNPMKPHSLLHYLSHMMPTHALPHTSSFTHYPHSLLPLNTHTPPPTPPPPPHTHTHTHIFLYIPVIVILPSHNSSSLLLGNT